MQLFSLTAAITLSGATGSTIAASRVSSSMILKEYEKIMMMIFND